MKTPNHALLRGVWPLVAALALCLAGCSSVLYEPTKFSKDSISFRRQAAKYGAVGSDPETCKAALRHDGFDIRAIRADRIPKTPVELRGFEATSSSNLYSPLPLVWNRVGYWKVRVIYRGNRIFSYEPKVTTYISFDL